MKGNLPYIIGGVLILGAVGFVIWKKKSNDEEKSADQLTSSSDTGTTSTQTTSTSSSSLGSSKTSSPSKPGSYLPSTDNIAPVGGPNSLFDQSATKGSKAVGKSAFAGPMGNTENEDFAFRGHTF